MKKTFYSTLLLSSLFLVGCQNGTEDTPEAEEDEQTEEVEEEIEEQENEDNDQEDADEENEEEAEEEKDFQYTINRDTFSVVPIDDEESDEKLVLLTFDDAPDGHTIEIADALEERDVSAIFFVNGMYMEDDEGFETMEEIHDRGFEIGNHTQTHAKLDDISEDEQHEEIVKTNELVEEATGETPRFFRAPHGVMTDYVEDLTEELNMTWTNWSFGFDWDPEYQDADALRDITLDNPYLSDGANILMHDREWTAEAIPEIIDGLIDQGYTIVDPSLIASGEDAE